MNRKLRTLAAVIIGLWCCLTVDAHDFEVDGIYYNVISTEELTVAVTCRGDYSNSYSDEYSGAVTIPSSVTFIVKEYSVTSIENGAFSGCSSLSSITIGKNVTTIDGSAFAQCTSLKNVVFEDGNEILTVEGFLGARKGIFYDCPLEKVYLGRNLSYVATQMGGYSPFYNKTTLTSLIVGEGVSKIGSYAFSNCSSLASITIPESVTSVGRYAFEGTAWYDSLYNSLPDGVVYVGDILYCYKGEMPEETSLKVRESTKGIADYAFTGCTGLASITIPESVVSIGEGSFSGCGNLISVIIGKRVATIGGSAFGQCTSLKNVVFEDGDEILAIECGSRRRGLFYDCPLEKVYLGRNLNYDTSSNAGSSPFYKKGALTSLIIGPEVTEIGENAFSGCGIDSIASYAAVPPTCYTSTFAGVDTSIPVYVPETSVTDYQSAEVWKDFLGLVGVDTGIDNQQLTTGKGQQTTFIYDLMGHRIANAEGLKGIYVVGGKKVLF